MKIPFSVGQKFEGKSVHHSMMDGRSETWTKLQCLELLGGSKMRVVVLEGELLGKTLTVNYIPGWFRTQEAQ